MLFCSNCLDTFFSQRGLVYKTYHCFSFWIIIPDLLINKNSLFITFFKASTVLGFSGALTYLANGGNRSIGFSGFAQSTHRWLENGGLKQINHSIETSLCTLAER